MSRGARGSLAAGLAALALAGGAVWALVAFWPGAAEERAVAAFLRARVTAGELVIVTPAGSLDRLRAYTAAGLAAVSANDERVAQRAGFSRAWLVGRLAGGEAPRVGPGWRTEPHVVGATHVVRATRDAGAPR